MSGIKRWAARTAVSAVALAGVGVGLTACNPPPNCTQLKQQYADVPVKNISQANAERTVWCLTNDERTSRGLAAFQKSTILDGTARAHAQNAVNRKWWVNGADPHTTPEGVTVTQRILGAGYCNNPTYYETAENVYWGWGGNGPTPRQAITWWMNSPGHRDNILSTSRKDHGVGVVLGAPAPGTYQNAAVFVQNFGVCVR